MPKFSVEDRSILLRRAGAYGLDIVLLFVVLASLAIGMLRALSLDPSTIHVYGALLLTFSIPAWAYFTLADCSRGGATLGKRVFSLRTETQEGDRLGLGRALARTAVKMVPWELSHVSAFLFVPAPGDLSIGNHVGLGIANILTLVYLVVAWRKQGRQSVHDLVVSTRVSPRT